MSDQTIPQLNLRKHIARIDRALDEAEKFRAEQHKLIAEMQSVDWWAPPFSSHILWSTGIWPAASLVRRYRSRESGDSPIGGVLGFCLTR